MRLKSHLKIEFFSYLLEIKSRHKNFTFCIFKITWIFKLIVSNVQRIFRKNLSRGLESDVINGKQKAPPTTVKRFPCKGIQTAVRKAVGAGSWGPGGSGLGAGEGRVPQSSLTEIQWLFFLIQHPPGSYMVFIIFWSS